MSHKFRTAARLDGDVLNAVCFRHLLNPMSTKTSIKHNHQVTIAVEGVVTEMPGSKNICQAKALAKGISPTTIVVAAMENQMQKVRAQRCPKKIEGRIVHVLR